MKLPTDFKVRYLTGVNRQGMIFTLPDIHLIYLLNEQRVMAQEQLYRFFCLFNPISDSAFRRKIFKLEKLGFLKRKSICYVQSTTFNKNFLLIERKGTEFLYRLGLAPDPYSKWTNVEAPKKNFDHHLGAKEVLLKVFENEALHGKLFGGGGGEHMFVNSLPVKKPTKIFNIFDPKLFVKNENDELLRTFLKENGFGLSEPEEHVFDKKDIMFSFRPSESSIYTSDDDTSILIPDASFRLNNNIIHVEIDTGTEKLRKGELDELYRTTSLEAKLEKYMFLAKEKPNLNHHLWLICLDNSLVFKNYYGNKELRISNIKKEMCTLKGINDLRNLNVTILRLGRFFSILPSLINEITLSEEKGLLFMFQNCLNFNRKHFPYKLISVPWDQYLEKLNIRPNSLPYKLEDIFIAEPRSKSDEITRKIFLPVFMKEGNLQSYDRLNYLSQKLRMEKLTSSSDTFLLAIYRTKHEMENDILSNELNLSNILFTSIDQAADTNAPIKFRGLQERNVFSFE